MRFEDVHAAVGPEEGRTAACAKCGAVEGEPCRYVAGRAFEIQPGDAMPDVHPERKAAIRARRLGQYRAEQRAERRRLAAWWRENGHIFTDMTEGL